MRFIGTLEEYPPRMKSFDLDVDEMMSALNPARSR
jgi:hypothetical protein